MQVIAKTVESLSEIAKQLFEFAGERNVFYLTGDIGAGKTTFVQSIAKHLGSTDKVTSPTYSIVNEYSFPKENGSTGIIYHIDLYRLNGEQEVFDIGIFEYLDRGDFIFIEWPQLIEQHIDEEVVKINVQIIENSIRNIIFL